MGNAKLSAAFLWCCCSYVRVRMRPATSPNRYEITKDQSGRTLRLDKRTGEIAVIEGERIAPIRDAKAVDAEKATKVGDLARVKNYPPLRPSNFGVEASLLTSWQDGKLLYALDFCAG